MNEELSKKSIFDFLLALPVSERKFLSKIINPEEQFIVLESDSKDKNIKQLEEEHLEAIKNSDFLYICNPQKYLGNSTIIEIGFAVANKKPIFSSEPIDDITLS